MELRPARREEAETCYQCIEDARVYHRSMGFVQWHPGYPTLEVVLDDIENGTGYAFEKNGTVVGYCCIVVGEEPAYREIEGAWKTERPYAVVHRMAFGEKTRGKGFSREAFALLRAFCEERNVCAIRVDTQEENKVMQRVLEREGFEYCGLIRFDGGPKLAYEWDR